MVHSQKKPQKTKNKSHCETLFLLKGHTHLLPLSTATLGPARATSLSTPSALQ